MPIAPTPPQQRTWRSRQPTSNAATHHKGRLVVEEPRERQLLLLPRRQILDPVPLIVQVWPKDAAILHELSPEPHMSAAPTLVERCCVRVPTLEGWGVL
eukprot:576401-Rhodomonas_salina.1